jgi:predicted RND superfamily exporter protein
MILEQLKNITKMARDLAEEEEEEETEHLVEMISAGVNDLNFERLERLLKEYYHKAPEDERENILQDLYHINIQLDRYGYHEFERFKEEYEVSKEI